MKTCLEALIFRICWGLRVPIDRRGVSVALN